MAFRQLLAVFGMAAAVAQAAPADTVRGSAAYLERIAMPPGATFTAVLEDISRADVAAPELGRATLTDAGNPPYAFEIDYDPAEIDQRGRYSVRARLDGPDGRLWFTTDTVAPVLTQGAGDSVDLRLVRVSQDDTAEVAPPLPAHGLRLPASFTGTLPCADCEGIAHHLDLWPDQSFHLRRVWLNGDASLTRDTLGRWHADAARGAIVLRGSGDTRLEFEVKGPQALRLLDQEGQPIVSDLPYDLTGDGTLDPTPVSLPMEGMFVYFADAALFEVCLTGQRFPVAMEADYLAAERAYLDAGLPPQEPVMMLLDGTLAIRPVMEGPDRQSLVIDRLIAVQPGRACAQARAEASLTDTYWKLRQLGGNPVEPLAGTREPHMVLHGADMRISATVGCNQMVGGYEMTDGTLRIGPMAMTMMACPPPLDDRERALSTALEAARDWQVVGQSLLLRDEADNLQAVFEAVYLP